MSKKLQLELVKKDYQKTLENLFLKIDILRQNPKFYYYFAWIEFFDVIEEKTKEGWEFRLLKQLRIDFLKAFPKPNLSWDTIHNEIIVRKFPKFLEQINNVVNSVYKDLEISLKVSKIFLQDRGIMGKRGVETILLYGFNESLPEKNGLNYYTIMLILQSHAYFDRDIDKIFDIINKEERYGSFYSQFL